MFGHKLKILQALPKLNSDLCYGGSLETSNTMYAMRPSHMESQMSGTLRRSMKNAFLLLLLLFFALCVHPLAFFFYPSLYEFLFLKDCDFRFCSSDFANLSCARV